LYTGSTGTGTPTDGYYYYDMTDKVWTISGGRVTAINDCPAPPPPPTPPTPPPPPAVVWTQIALGFGTGGGGGSACQRANTDRTGTYWINNEFFEDATAISSTSDGTGAATNGFYSDGSIVRQSSSGVLTGNTACIV
jgi:hypothetical protein